MTKNNLGTFKRPLEYIANKLFYTINYYYGDLQSKTTNSVIFDGRYNIANGDKCFSGDIVVEYELKIYHTIVKNKINIKTVLFYDEKIASTALVLYESELIPQSQNVTYETSNYSATDYQNSCNGSQYPNYTNSLALYKELSQVVADTNKNNIDYIDEVNALVLKTVHKRMKYLEEPYLPVNREELLTLAVPVYGGQSYYYVDLLLGNAK